MSSERLVRAGDLDLIEEMFGGLKSRGVAVRSGVEVWLAWEDRPERSGDMEEAWKPPNPSIRRKRLFKSIKRLGLPGT